MMQKKRTVWIVLDCLYVWVKLGVFNTAIYRKIDWCSFKSFEQ